MFCSIVYEKYYNRSGKNRNRTGMQREETVLFWNLFVCLDTERDFVYSI